MTLENTNIILFGGLIIDQYIYVDRWPEKGQDGFISSENNFVGGCSINMEATITNLIHSFDKRQVNVHTVSYLGEDAEAEIICQYMKKHALSEKLLFQGDGTTGKCMVFVSPDGERTFLTKEGVEGIFTPEMEESILNMNAKVAGVTGYYLLGEYGEKVVSCLKKMKEAGTIILFDPGSLADQIPENVLEDVLDVAQIITPNQGELSLMGGENLLARYQKEGKTVFLKSGSDGGILFHAHKKIPYSAKKCENIDSTGAGDSFAGAILYGIASGLSMEEALDLAVICAAKTVTVSGPHGFWRLDYDR